MVLEAAENPRRLLYVRNGMRNLLLDPLQTSSESDRYLEVWNGVTVMSPIANNEHQKLITRLMAPLIEVIISKDLGEVYPGLNVSDRGEDWSFNYRGPDIAVVLKGNPAIDHGTHLQGGPDFLIEIISPREDAYAKFEFYAQVKTREVLVVHRDPWALELFRQDDEQFELVGRSEVGHETVLTSEVAGLTYQLIEGAPRPTIRMTHPARQGTWTA
jgi:Uma2 family endonuclease